MATATETLGEELEGLDVTACRERVAVLQAERERRRESSERLQEKLKALNYELAARKEEAERQRRELNEVQERLRPERTPGRGLIVPTDAFEQEEDDVRRFVEQQLCRFIDHHFNAGMSRRQAVNELGIREFDERDLMVEKPRKIEKAEALNVDTVLITHYRTASSEHKFHLSYRVDWRTTAKQLREDACLYWGISEVEYVLWTMVHSKVQDDLDIQSIFKPGEEAHLILAPKTPKKTEPAERIFDLIRPKVGAKRGVQKRRQQGAEAQPRSGDKTETLEEQMGKVPGLLEFMKQGDQKVVAHIKEIKPVTLCVYTLLVVLTTVSFGLMKPPNLEYLCRLGVYNTVAADPTRPFADIRSQGDVWQWLTYAVPGQLLNSTSELRRSNYLPGWLRIRVQQVRNASKADCLAKDYLRDSDTCFPQYYDATTAETNDLERVRIAWQGKPGVDGRSPSITPWRWVSSKDAWNWNNALAEAGTFQKYDASGYCLDYNLQHSNLTNLTRAFTQDMAALRAAGWISNKTRAVHLSFSTYNGNYDYWVSSWYLLELPVSGLVRPTSDVDVYNPALDGLRQVGVESLSVDTCRLVLVAYVAFYEVTHQVLVYRKRGIRWWRYFTSPLGIADVASIVLMLAVYSMRFFQAKVAGSAAVRLAQAQVQGYYAELAAMQQYRATSLLDAFLYAIFILRMLSTLRVHRRFFLIWETLRASTHRYGRFLFIFVPVITGFILVGFAMWNSELEGFRTFWGAATSILMVLLGDITVLNIGKAARPWTLIFSVAFFVFIVLFFINMWTAVLLQEYQKTRVAAGYNPRKYDWTEPRYVRWLMPRWMENLWWKLRPSKKGPEEEDDK